MKSITACPLCGSMALKKLPFEYWHEFERYPGCKCGDCGLVFLSVQPEREELAAMYGAHYFESDFRCGSAPAHCLGGAESDRVFAQEAESALSLIERFTGRKGGRLLEVGCAGGWLLRAARESGWKVSGVEISPEAAEFARSEHGLDVFCGELAEIRFAPGSFDVIYMADVLEHIPDPVGFVRELRRVLAEGGHVVVCGPMALNSLARRLGLLAYGLFGRTRSIAIAPYHLFEYTPETLRLLFNKGGLEVVRMIKKKTPPSLRTETAEGLATLAVELFNYPVTTLLGVWGDRVALCARPSGYASVHLEVG